MIPRLYVPLLEPEDVIRHLGKQEEQWKEGRSAHALATVWSESNCFPPQVKAALQTIPAFQTAELVDAFLERQVHLGSKGRHSQTDLLAIAGIGNDQLAVIAVEGKAGETFGERVAEWFDGSDGKKARLEGLCEILSLKRDEADSLRYQLLHRTASAILEAKRYRTDIAVLLVHSFCDDKKGFADFGAFLEALGFNEPTANALQGPVSCDGMFLYAGWVQDEAPIGDGPVAYLDDLRDYAARLAQDCERLRSWCDKQQAKR